MRITFLAIALILFVATTAEAQSSYSVVDLGSLNGGHDTSALAINNQGHVVGTANDANGHYIAFFYAGTLQGLGTLGGGFSKANGINSSDHIVGRSTTASGDTHAFLYDAAQVNPVMVDLHNLIGFGGNFSSAISINDAGQIVGVATVAGGNSHAFLLTGNTAIDLHSMVSFGGSNSSAYSISNTGLIVGFSDNANGESRAFLYDLNTSTLTNLGTLGGLESNAWAVNASGVVVGESITSAGGSTTNAFQTVSPNPLAPPNGLGTFGGTYSTALGINALGQIVGAADDATDSAHAFLYTTATGMQDLETLIPADSGWFFISANAINDSGYIVGNGVHDWRSAAFLLVPNATPTPTPTPCPTGSHATKLFAVSRQGGNSTNEVFRYEVGPTGAPTLDLTLMHSSLDRPFGIAVSAAGELFIVNSGPESGGSGSVSRFLNAGASPSFNGAILSSSFNNPMLASFRNGELFIAQRFGAGALRFLFDGAGNASFNGAIAGGLTPGHPRGVAANPTTGELFVTECCGVTEINRYVFDGSGNAVPNGVITGGGLNNPHDLAFSPWGELFVVNSGSGSVLRVVFDNSGNATFNGQLTGNGLCNPIGLAFSPWGELFVSNHSCPTISRWVFDGAHNAIPNGTFSTPATLGDLEFLPAEEDQISISCPSPTTASADSNCQASVPDLLADLTASGGCGSVTLSQSPTAGTLVGLGTTTITVTATDATNNSTSCTTTFTVNDDSPPTIACPANIDVVDNVPGSCGALLTPSTPAAADNCGLAEVSATRSDGRALTDPYPVGTTTINWIAADASGNTASCSQTITVANPAPSVSITGPASGTLYVVNTAVSFSGSFTDNAGDSHTAVWTFDGVPQAGTVNESAQTVSASHTFDSAGVYLVTLTITDDCGQTVSNNQVGGFDAFVVVYDPNAGFVTGGGWINSPVGAFTPNPSLVGKANFGFVSRYQKGANIPDGQTEFQFKVANLNFHSTVYEWLVVAGARAQYKGSGTINGTGNYGFMLTAVDGEINGGGGIDKFRIKIWDKNNGDAIVYDNQMGAGIDDSPTTVLGGGSIVIHR